MTDHKQTHRPDNGEYAVSVHLTIQQLIEEAYEKLLEPDYMMISSSFTPST